MSVLFIQELDSAAGRAGIIAMGSSLSLVLFLFGVTFTPKLMPKLLWSKHIKGNSVIYHFNAEFIIPLLTLSISFYAIMAAFEPRLVVTSRMGMTWLFGILGVLVLIQSSYKLFTDRSINLDLKVDTSGITIGNVDYSQFNSEEIESIKSSGKSMLFPRLEIYGRGIQTSGSWIPGNPKVKTIHYQILGGMSFGHGDPQEISREIQQRLKKTDQC